MKMREEYEAWFIGKFGFPPMPIHSRVLDFCWEGYQSGRKNSESEIAELRQQRQGLLEDLAGYSGVDAEIAELRQQRAEHVYWQDQLHQQLQEVCNAIGSPEYMDPPDGGSVTIAEQVSRMREDRDQLRQKVTLLRDATVMALPEIAMCEAGCSAISAMKKALATTELI